MSEIPQTKMLAQISRRRRVVAFLSVAAATFFGLSLIWPMTTKSWRSESEVSLSLTNRNGANEDFQSLLADVVARHTSVESIKAAMQDNGLLTAVDASVADSIAADVVNRLRVNAIASPFDAEAVQVRVGYEGLATEKENYFVNLLATTLARDLMTSPLAGILPDTSIPASTIEELRSRKSSIEAKANELLAQIGGNLKLAANQLAQAKQSGNELVAPFAPRQRDSAKLELNDLVLQRQRIADAEGDVALELAAIDQQIDAKRADIDELEELANKRKSDGPFQMASHTLNKSDNGSGVGHAIDSLQVTITELANITADACGLAESASVVPAFEINGVYGRSAVPVGATPGRRELLFLVLASTVFASIVSLSYHPFFEAGFDGTQDVEKQLKIPVVATIQNRVDFEDVTGPGIPAESDRSDAAGSNQVVYFCKWVLFCSLMLTIGFCLVNSEIRDAFLDGPFHGYARIFWAIKGN